MSLSTEMRVAAIRFVGAVTILGAVTWAAATHSMEPEQSLLDRAKHTLSTFKSSATFSNFDARLSEAKAVLIVPSVIKAAFLVGGEGGAGVLLARDGTPMGWGYPAFYKIAAGSLGLQLGAQESETVFLILSDQALQKLMSNELKLGVDVGAAVADAGTGVEGSTTTTFEGDIVAYSESEGLYVGASFEGAVLSPDQKANQSYYGRPVSPEDIVAGKATNKSADSLRAALRGG